MALWLCRAGGHGEHEQKFLDEGRVYLTWHGLDRDLGRLPDLKALRAVLTEKYPKSPHGLLSQNSGQIWAFSHRMAPGDWLAMPSKHKTIHIAEIAGDYAFVPKGPDPYYHYRAVKWLETDIPRTNFDRDILNSLGAFTTVCQIKRNDAEARHQHLSLREAGVELLDCDHKTPAAQDLGRPYIAIPQLKAGRIDPSGARLIGDDDFEEWTRKTRPQAWDVVLSRRCNPGETAFVSPGFEFALGQNLVILRSTGRRVYGDLSLMGIDR